MAKIMGDKGDSPPKRIREYPSDPELWRDAARRSAGALAAASKVQEQAPEERFPCRGLCMSAVGVAVRR